VATSLQTIRIVRNAPGTMHIRQECVNALSDREHETVIGVSVSYSPAVELLCKAIRFGALLHAESDADIELIDPDNAYDIERERDWNLL